MTTFLFIVVLLLGILIGRIYGWMKYHYPEFQEKVKLEAARYRVERARLEAEEEEHRQRIDEILEGRMRP